MIHVLEAGIEKVRMPLFEMPVVSFAQQLLVEMKLPGRYRLDGALRGALKSAPGVSYLEDA